MPRSRAYVRRAVHSRSKRTWSAIAPGPAKRAHSPVQYGCRATKLSSSPCETGAFGSARSEGEPANADAARYGEPSSSGGPSGSTCHHDCPAASSQSRNRYASAPRRPSGSDVGCKKIPAERGSFIAARVLTVSVPPIVETPQGVPLPKTNDPPARIQIQRVTPQVDCGRYPVKRTVGDRIDVTARIFRDGHDLLGAAIRYKPAGAAPSPQ